MPRAAVSFRLGIPPVVGTVALDPPQDGEVRMRIEACAICHSDLGYVDGAWGGDVPAVFGHEAAGTVLEIGPGVEGLAEGDLAVLCLVRSCGACARCAEARPALCEGRFRLDDESPIRLPDGRRVRQGLRCGAFADEVVVHASQVIPLGDGVSAAAGCVIGCGVLTGIGAVEHVSGLEPGGSVAVVGVGGVGVNALQGAVLGEASLRIAIDVSAARLRSAPDFGATHVVDARAGDAVRQVRALAGGGGVDVAVVTVGAAAAVAQSIDLVRPGGTVVLVGMPPAGELVSFDAGALAHEGKRILGTKLGDARPGLDVPRIVDLYRAGRIRLDELVTATYPLDQVDRALDEARAGRGLRTVIVP